MDWPEFGVFDLVDLNSIHFVLEALINIVCNKPFIFTGLDYLGPYIFQQNCRDCKEGACYFRVFVHAACT